MRERPFLEYRDTPTAPLQEPTASRGTALVASTSDSFRDILGEMVSRCGFLSAYCAHAETAAASLARTRPRVIVCDGDLPEATIARLRRAAATHRIPVLVSLPHGPSGQDVRLFAGAHRLAFPVAQLAFGAILEELLDGSIAPPTARLEEPDSAR